MRYPLACVLETLEGVSKKTNNPYRIVKLRIDTELYGELEILLDTRHDKTGIVLDMLARAKENERKECK